MQNTAHSETTGQRSRLDSSQTPSRASRKILRDRALLALFDQLESVASISPRERETQLMRALNPFPEDEQFQSSRQVSKSVNRKYRKSYRQVRGSVAANVVR